MPDLNGEQISPRQFYRTQVIHAGVNLHRICSTLHFIKEECGVDISEDSLDAYMGGALADAISAASQLTMTIHHCDDAEDDAKFNAVYRMKVGGSFARSLAQATHHAWMEHKNSTWAAACGSMAAAYAMHVGAVFHMALAVPDFVNHEDFSIEWLAQMVADDLAIAVKKAAVAWQWEHQQGGVRRGDGNPKTKDRRAVDGLLSDLFDGDE